MRDQLQGDGVDARQAGQRAAPQLGQLTVVAARQVVADGADLLAHNVGVVEQPLGGGADRNAALDILGEGVLDKGELPLVLVERGAQRVARGQQHGVAVIGGQVAGVGLKLGEAQELAAQRAIGRLSVGALA